MKGKAIVKMVFALATALLLTGLLCFLLRLHAAGKLDDTLNLNWIIVHSFNDRDYNVGGGEFEDIDALEINWAGGAVEIFTYDGDTLCISEPIMANAEDQLRWRIENDSKLVIQTCKATLLRTNAELLNKTLTVQIPADWQISHIEINGATADVRISELTLGGMEIDLAVGDLTLDHCRFSNLDIEVADGNCTATDTVIQRLDMDAANGTVYISGAVDSADIDAATAKLTLITDVTPYAISIDMAAGSADITLPADAEFTASYSRIAGGLRVEGFDTVQRSEDTVCGNGSAKYEFDGVAGEIIIRAAAE